MTLSRTLRVDGPEWSRLQELIRTGVHDSGTAAEILAEHRDAPVRGSLVAAHRDRGTETLLTMSGDQIVLVTQRLARVDGRRRVEPGAQVTFTTPEDLWRSIARTLPDTGALRAPSSAAAGSRDQRLELSPDATLELLSREDYALRVRVEAWCGGEMPSVAWDRQWSVADDRLLDVRREGATIKLVERAAGSVAAELRWALIAAFDATTTSPPRDE
ncbi:hypothetical protein ACFO6V_27090 [Promicromonospora alba]|uniref:ESAT-6 protein secretion system EspG family protein n=1 Tax=Promicromonospora alba TaxID=1616110 RepID=A0ABV9HQK2_9MICO